MLDFKRKVILIVIGILIIISAGSAQALPTLDSRFDWVTYSYWTLTDKTTGEGGEITFELLSEDGDFESNFGLYTVDDLENPTNQTMYEVFNATKEPTETGLNTYQTVYFKNTAGTWEISLGNDVWDPFGNIFGFYFQVTNTQHTYYSDSRLNSPYEEQAYDHVQTGFDGTSMALIYLEDQPNLGDADFQGMFVQAIDVAPAPVPEPGTMALLGIGLLGLAGIQRRRFRRN